MVITSNRALDEWYPLFMDDLMASAAMDRLLHHSHTVVMEGHSFRNPPPSVGSVVESAIGIWNTTYFSERVRSHLPEALRRVFRP